MTKLNRTLTQRWAPEQMLTFWLPLLRERGRRDLADDAITDADRVLDDDAAAPAAKARALAVRGIALRDQEKYADAKADLEQAKKDLPVADGEWVLETEMALAEASDPSAYFASRAEAFRQEGRAAQAFALLNRALETAGPAARARLLVERGTWRLDDALARGKGRAAADDPDLAAARKDAEDASDGGSPEALLPQRPDRRGTGTARHGHRRLPPGVGRPWRPGRGWRPLPGGAGPLAGAAEAGQAGGAAGRGRRQGRQKGRPAVVGGVGGAVDHRAAAGRPSRRGGRGHEGGAEVGGRDPGGQGRRRAVRGPRHGPGGQGPVDGSFNHLCGGASSVTQPGARRRADAADPGQSELAAAVLVDRGRPAWGRNALCRRTALVFRPRLSEGGEGVFRRPWRTTGRTRGITTSWVWRV